MSITATQSLIEPRSCREYIMRAERDDAIVSRARQAQYANNWTWEQTLEYMVVALLENKQHLTNQLIDLHMCTPSTAMVMKGDIDNG